MLTGKLTKLVFSCVMAFMAVFAHAYEDDGLHIAATDVYDFRMSLRVPRIYDNNQSLGSRKYQQQRVVGEMWMQYDSNGNLVNVLFTNMVNKTHRLSNGKLLTYPTTQLNEMVYPRFNAIGSNRTGKFKVASVCFYLVAEPSYNIGELDEDNALYVMLAGRGTFHSSKRYLKVVTGKVAGTLGCGCMAYGHTSPTRRIGYWGATDDVDDVAAVDGTWSMRFNSSKSSKR